MKGYRLNIGPASFTEGDGILRETSLSGFGGTALLVGEEFILKKFRGELKRALKSVRIANGGFAGECSENEIKRLCALGKNKKADFVTGIGGGKALDTAKAAAGRLKLPVVTIPTSAATCAAWTALSAVYTDEGSSRTYILLDRCPDLLILDTGIIASCPARYLRSGMADALAKFYEAMAFTGGSSPGRGIEAALGIARSIYDTVF